MSKKGSLGERMKFYESLSGDARLMPRIPTVARLDGKAFHTFCRGLERPYDARLGQLMQDTTAFLVKETNPVIGYTQSDEITLIWLNEERDSMIFFDGRVHKMVSVLASMASTFFNNKLADRIPEKADSMPVFDCRVFNLPSKEEAVNNLIWREQDATRNSVSMAAQSLYSHKELHKKNTANMHDMLHAKGINWNDYPSCQKRGAYIRRENYIIEGGAMRTRVVPVEFPPLVKIENRVDVIFDRVEPLLKD